MIGYWDVDLLKYILCVSGLMCVALGVSVLASVGACACADWWRREDR